MAEKPYFSSAAAISAGGIFSTSHCQASRVRPRTEPNENRNVLVVRYGRNISLPSTLLMGVASGKTITGIWKTIEPGFNLDSMSRPKARSELIKRRALAVASGGSFRGDWS